MDDKVYENNIEEVSVGAKIKDNPTLLISEIQKKVILPYSKGEVKEIYRNNKDVYKDEHDVIEKVFTKDFYYYRHQFTSRFREAVELITKREKICVRQSNSCMLENSWK